MVQNAVTVDSFGLCLEFLEALANSFSSPDIGTFRTNASIRPTNSGRTSITIPTAKSTTILRCSSPTNRTTPKAISASDSLKVFFTFSQLPLNLGSRA